MESANKHANSFFLNAIRQKGTPISEFRFDGLTFKHADDDPNDGGDLPVSRNDLWQDMLRNLFGCVPEGAEGAPPLHCEIYPDWESYNFAGLAGLPPSVRLMDGFFPVRDQSKRGACFAFALVALCEYMLGKTVELSEQSLFLFTKLVTQGKVEELGDGAVFLDSIHAVEEYGICPLSEWHYNPESWNYVEDPCNEGQNVAFQRKLAAAQQYRFRNWRTLSPGSVLQFKQVLSSKMPIYTGVAVTPDWHSKEARSTGRIPYPRLKWIIRILKPTVGMVRTILEEKGLDPDEESGRSVVENLLNSILNYLESSVFKKPMSIVEAKEDDDVVLLKVYLDGFIGGHALCLAGYVDDNSYAGGGYFIARNSWSDVEWAPESPEMPGYALIPYAYVADFGAEGVAMSDFPEPRHAGAAAGMPMSASADGGFDVWLAARKATLTRPTRDDEGLLLRPGTPVLVPDPANPDRVFRDMPESREKMRNLYEEQLREASAAAEKERQAQERAIADARLIRFETVLREAIDSAFAADEYAVMSLAKLKAEMLSRDADLAAVPEIDSRIRASVIALQKSDRRKCWFGRGFGGVEEIRPSGTDSDRIFV